MQSEVRERQTSCARSSVHKMVTQRSESHINELKMISCELTFMHLICFEHMRKEAAKHKIFQFLQLLDIHALSAAFGFLFFQLNIHRPLNIGDPCKSMNPSSRHSNIRPFAFLHNPYFAHKYSRIQITFSLAQTDRKRS